MDLVQFFMPDAQAAELMQSGDGALDHLTQLAQAGAVRHTAPGQSALDAALSQNLPMPLRVISPITESALRAIAWRTRLAPDRWNRINQGQQLGHIVGVGTREDRRQWDAVGIGDQTMFGAGLATIRRIRSSFPPEDGAYRR